MAKTILIVDDDPTQRRLLQAALERQGFVARMAQDGEQALGMLTGPGLGGVDLVLLDLVMPGLSGAEVLREIRARTPDLPVIVLTAHGGIETVVQAMQSGASDFFVKPASPERILVSVRNSLKITELKGEVSRLKRKADGQVLFEDLIAEAPVMRNVLKMAKRAASSAIPVLILGESGVGKELLARAIHGASERAGKPFVAVNCGAIPESLVESILFGHERGAFTGAVDRHQGKFQEANGGTLFLDEVGELPIDMQVKLLRALQESEVDPVGSKRPVKVDVRILSATNRDLSTLVSEGRFREDLYYRLNVFPVEAPPLRERREDIPALVSHFIQRFNAEEGKTLQGASAATLSLLQISDWPGNVRQLENAIFRAVVLCDGAELQIEDFPQLAGVRPATMAEPTPSPFEGSALQIESRKNGLPVYGADGHLRPFEAIEKDLIRLALETYDGRMTEIARRLGIGRSTLYRKLREYGFEEPFEAREAG